jgi:uncharacterized integral membrane protein (TIGR00698 family)
MSNHSQENEPASSYESGGQLSDEAVGEGHETQTFFSEDWVAVILGGGLLTICLIAVLLQGANADGDWSSPLKPLLSKPGEWEASIDPLQSVKKAIQAIPWVGVIGAGISGYLIFGIGNLLLRRDVIQFTPAYIFVFCMATLAYVLSGNATVKAYNLEYALWALAFGLLISNTIGTPHWVKPAVQTELYIKTGLVLLGSGILFSKLLALGLPGICIAWIVTPVVLISTFWIGQKVLKIRSPSLNMVISADMSVCGVSAAVATSAACKAKKEELSLAIGISLSFTVIMMVLMPMLIKATGMNPIVGGAWLGGTIDATGAVVAAGTFLGGEAETVAATIKMIQNILIGVIAFGVAVYWTTSMENNDASPNVGFGEIWKRFPKFILGFIAASLLFSILYAATPDGPDIVDATVKESTKTLRGWFFCLAFVSIGLETNFRSLWKNLEAGKPLLLYLIGQAINLVLTLGMAYLMFEIVFPSAAEALLR